MDIQAITQQLIDKMELDILRQKSRIEGVVMLYEVIVAELAGKQVPTGEKKASGKKEESAQTKKK